jgi:hypothetical protein
MEKRKSTVAEFAEIRRGTDKKKAAIHETAPNDTK